MRAFLICELVEGAGRGMAPWWRGQVAGRASLVRGAGAARRWLRSGEWAQLRGGAIGPLLVGCTAESSSCQPPIESGPEERGGRGRHGRRCRRPPPPGAALQADGKPLPTKMLALMTVLEKEGPEFAEKLLATVRGESAVALMAPAAPAP